ncbi:MAG: DUF1298 domain-containing protein [Pseudomonadales bacterium]|nr:DUF1298 domain-containing protein [Pseudomonadales bacterium]
MKNTSNTLAATCLTAIVLIALFETTTTQLITLGLYSFSAFLTFKLATKKNRLALSWAAFALLLPFIAPILLIILKPRPTNAIDVIDKCWLNMERDTNLMMVVGILLFDAPVSIDKLKGTLTNRLLTFGRFTSKLQLDGRHLCWQPDSDFDLNNHIEQHELIDPNPKQALNALANTLAETALQQDKPLWKLHLVSYGNSPETLQTAIIIRIHHCIGDGIALIRVLLSMTDPTKITTTQPTKPSTQASKTKDKSFRGTLSSNISFLLQFAFAFKSAFLLPDSNTSLKAPLSGKRKLAWSAPADLARIKKLAHQQNGKINDIVLAATAGALRRYFENNNEKVDNLCLRALVPINIRPISDEIVLGNKVGFVYFPLPIEIDSPIERLLETKTRMDNIKGGQEALLSYGFLVLLGLLPKSIQHPLVDLLNNNASTTMTNVPGPKEELSMASSPIQNLMFFGPQSGKMGVGISVLSYNGKVTLGVSADENMIPDPGLLVSYFTQEIEEWPE